MQVLPAGEATSLDTYHVGDSIEHHLLSGFHMEVLDTASCETDFVHPEPHPAYKIIDFLGNADWLCAHDVHRV